MSDQDIQDKISGGESTDKQMLIKLTKYYQTTQPKIAEFTKQLGLKDKIIAALKTNLLDLQKERDIVLAELEETKNEINTKYKQFEGQVPQKILERIVAGNRTWCLVEYPEVKNDENSENEDENEDEDILNMKWMTQEELVERVNECGINLNLPSLGLSSNEATILRNQVKQLEETLSSLETEYKKYRVDMEMMIWNKNTQIENLQNVANDNKTTMNNDANVQLQVDYESLKMQKEGLLMRTDELESTIRTLEADKEVLQKEIADIGRRLEIVANEAEDWKRKYKVEIKKKRDDILNKEGEDIEEESAITKLKKEIELLKKRLATANAAATTANATTHNDTKTESTLTPDNYEYLRNIVPKYFGAKDRESKERMSTAILTVLKFTPQEIKKIKKPSTSSWW